jgi:hypothetical protein
MNALEKPVLTISKQFKHAVVSSVVKNRDTLIVEATASYIPIEQFKEIFNHIGEIVKREKITKLIFDKRKLTVFHQPSMEWYFVEWKEKMFGLGLTQHRKILPQDRIFRESVKIGRDKINKTYPAGKFHQMSILYAESLEEALAM